jgi:adenine-specific DNA-methyltransferase
MRQAENHQIFTPTHIVDLMLDTVGYTEDNILKKTIMEPSFGDGAFLCKIVERIIDFSRIRM